jgi:hypothetical protein
MLFFLGLPGTYKWSKKNCNALEVD